MKRDRPCIGLLAGEPSGDRLGAALMRAITERVPSARFEGIGGPCMQALGFDSLWSMERLSVMGLVEPLKRLPELLRLRRSVCRHFGARPPAVFVGIDAPDFNLGVERFLHMRGVPTAHYVSPSVWAWRQGRVAAIAEAVDLMITLLPFEARFYEEHGVPVVFAGHPLADEIALTTDTAAAKERLGYAATDTVVAVLPGSRGGEVARLWPLFAETVSWCAARRPDLHFVVPAAGAARHCQLATMLAGDNRPEGVPPQRLQLLEGESHAAMAAADVVLLASGTASLEAMLLKKPMVVAYRLGPVSWQILRRLVKSKFVALPNLLADRALVPELLQEAATPAALGREILRWLDDTNARERYQRECTGWHHRLRRNAAAAAADAVLGLMPGASDECWR